ncbi:uncharacterized protein LOC131636640 [Vicia villosa]|uniref:uncharacterized protein LOC131636640 n=1 Tax=Vicia villosa TaxID=3911 RepID=UPI00273AE8D0|nr:uncharacterized protein LOC131636640 [Vicia villosa]
MTAIYAHNDLTLRKSLWKDLEDIHKNQQGPWCVVGDFNNVASSQDRIGGNLVTEAEYEDFQAMMDTTGQGKWTVQVNFLLGPISSQAVLTILPPHVSDHAVLYLATPGETCGWRQFRFNNCLVNVVGYLECVERNWAQPTRGTPMQKVWFKQKRLKPDLLKL